MQHTTPRAGARVHARHTPQHRTNQQHTPAKQGTRDRRFLHENSSRLERFQGSLKPCVPLSQRRLPFPRKLHLSLERVLLRQALDVLFRRRVGFAAVADEVAVLKENSGYGYGYGLSVGE